MVSTNAPYVFDSIGRMLSMALTDDDESTYTGTYTNDPTGPMALTDDDESTYTGTYTNDPTGQLTDAVYTGGGPSTEDYDYDANGNRYDEGPTGYNVGLHNRMTDDDAGFHYLYDAEGNRTYRFVDVNSDGVISSTDTDITEYTWDHRNRLVGVKEYATYNDFDGNDPDLVVEYYYDHENRWIRKTRDTDADETIDGGTIFVYHGPHAVLQFDKTTTGDLAASDLSHRYLYGPAIDQILADEQVVDLQNAGTVYWPITDHLGSVRDLIDNTATIQLHRTYNAFGESTDSGTVDCLYNYTGRPLDEDSGFQNNRQRWYDLKTHTWVSEDPIAADFNSYRYVGNTLIRAIDPLGLDQYNLTPPQMDGSAKIVRQANDDEDGMCALYVDGTKKWAIEDWGDTTQSSALGIAFDYNWLKRKGTGTITLHTA